MRPLNLPQDANTWGFDQEGRLVYLVRFVFPIPADGICTCGFVINETDLKKRLDVWEAHSLIHRVWRYADTGKRFGNGLVQHKRCQCPILYNNPPMWCFDCGGYVSLENTFQWFFTSVENRWSYRL